MAWKMLLAVVVVAPAMAGEADVIAARAVAEADGRYRIEATLRHADQGWQHYADRFDVLTPDGRLLGSRTLHHPHVDEQPFTRALTVEVPAGIDRVRVRGHDSVHGLGGATVELDLPR